MVAELKFIVNFFYIFGKAEINQSVLFSLQDISDVIPDLQVK